MLVALTSVLKRLLISYALRRTQIQVKGVIMHEHEVRKKATEHEWEQGKKEREYAGPLSSLSLLLACPYNCSVL